MNMNMYDMEGLIPFAQWSRFVDPAVSELICSNGQALLSVRCPDCDDTAPHYEVSLARHEDRTRHIAELRKELSCASSVTPPEEMSCHSCVTPPEDMSLPEDMYYMTLKRHMLKIGVLPAAVDVCMGKNELLIVLAEHQRQAADDDDAKAAAASDDAEAAADDVEAADDDAEAADDDTKAAADAEAAVTQATTELKLMKVTNLCTQAPFALLYPPNPEAKLNSQAWARYSTGAISPESFIGCLLELVPPHPGSHGFDSGFGMALKTAKVSKVAESLHYWCLSNNELVVQDETAPPPLLDGVMPTLYQLIVDPERCGLKQQSNQTLTPTFLLKAPCFDACLVTFLPKSLDTLL